MYAYEILYRENGILKNKGFKYRDQFDRFIAKMEKKSNVKIIETKINCPIDYWSRPWYRPGYTG